MHHETVYVAERTAGPQTKIYAGANPGPTWYKHDTKIPLPFRIRTSTSANETDIHAVKQILAPQEKK